jgi:hypothetical protein
MTTEENNNITKEHNMVDNRFNNKYMMEYLHLSVKTDGKETAIRSSWKVTTGYTCLVIWLSLYRFAYCLALIITPLKHPTFKAWL